MLAALCAGTGVTAQAVAALPKITVTGTVATSIDMAPGYVGTLAYDTSSWFGKSFTLELVADATGVVRVANELTDIPGGYDNTWEPISVSYNLAILGGPTFSGTDNQFSWLDTINDVTVPSGVTDLPDGIIADGTHTYDAYGIGASNIQLACYSGGSNSMCDGESADVYEGGSISFDYNWDTAVYNAIHDNNLPDLLNAAPDFAQGFGSVGFEIWHWSQDAGGSDVARLQLDISSVTVTAVPEPETYAMMLAGLGLVGAVVRRRKNV